MTDVDMDQYARVKLRVANENGEITLTEVSDEGNLTILRLSEDGARQLHSEIQKVLPPKVTWIEEEEPELDEEPVLTEGEENIWTSALIQALKSSMAACTQVLSKNKDWKGPPDLDSGTELEDDVVMLAFGDSRLWVSWISDNEEPTWDVYLRWYDDGTDPEPRPSDLSVQITIDESDESVELSVKTPGHEANSTDPIMKLVSNREVVLFLNMFMKELEEEE